MIHNPKHPGLLVKSLCPEPLELSVTEAAKALKVSRPALSKLIICPVTNAEHALPTLRFRVEI
jgi:plasmid maintenance system antidote protein VapI